MITRDPLKNSLPDGRVLGADVSGAKLGEYLARTLRLRCATTHRPVSLPHVSGLDDAARRQQEEANVKLCLATRATRSDCGGVAWRGQGRI